MFSIQFRKCQSGVQHFKVLMVSIRCGQNPTGCTLSVERRKKIYALAQRFDFIIIEDGEKHLHDMFFHNGHLQPRAQTPTTISSMNRPTTT